MKKLINSNWEFLLESKENAQWQIVDLPHDWAIDMPFDENMQQGGAQGFRNRFSKGSYRKSIHIEKTEKDKKYYLHFDGVFENSTVIVNGRYAGGKKIRLQSV